MTSDTTEPDELDTILLNFAKRVENMRDHKTYGWEDEKAAIERLIDERVAYAIGEDERPLTLNDLPEQPGEASVARAAFARAAHEQALKGIRNALRAEQRLRHGGDETKKGDGNE